MKHLWLVYLQFLFTVGQFNTSPNWVDKQIVMCYTKLDELNVDYAKIYHFDKK